MRARSSSSPVLRWFLIADNRFVRNSCVSWALSSFTMTFRHWYWRFTWRQREANAHQIHRLRYQSTWHSNVDSSFLPITSENPDLWWCYQYCHKIWNGENDTLMPAICRVWIVSGTPSCSLSSIAVAPSKNRSFSINSAAWSRASPRPLIVAAAWL